MQSVVGGPRADIDIPEVGVEYLSNEISIGRQLDLQQFLNRVPRDQKISCVKGGVTGSKMCHCMNLEDKTSPCVQEGNSKFSPLSGAYGDNKLVMEPFGGRDSKNT